MSAAARARQKVNASQNRPARCASSLEPENPRRVVGVGVGVAPRARRLELGERVCAAAAGDRWVLDGAIVRTRGVYGRVRVRGRVCGCASSSSLERVCDRGRVRVSPAKVARGFASSAAAGCPAAG